MRVSEDDDAVTDAAVTLIHTVTGADEYEDPADAVQDFARDGKA